MDEIKAKVVYQQMEIQFEGQLSLDLNVGGWKITRRLKLGGWNRVYTNEVGLRRLGDEILDNYNYNNSNPIPQLVAECPLNSNPIIYQSLIWNTITQED
jgi:hypothetical protein